jgi:hypothetical protein
MTNNCMLLVFPKQHNHTRPYPDSDFSSTRSLSWDPMGWFFPLVNFKWVIYQGFRIFGISKKIFCHVIVIMIHMSCWLFIHISIYPYIYISIYPYIIYLYIHTSIHKYIYIKIPYCGSIVSHCFGHCFHSPVRSGCERFAASPSSDSNRPKVSVNPAPRQRERRRA